MHHERPTPYLSGYALDRHCDQSSAAITRSFELSYTRQDNGQNELSAEEGMLVEFGEQFAQAQDFLETVGGKSRLSRELRNLRGVEFHVRTEPSLEGKRVSGTMSFQVGTQWFPGRLSAR